MLGTRLLTAFALLSLSTVSWANFYIGVGAGPTMTKFNKDRSVINPGLGNTINENVVDKSNQTATGLFGTIFAGYGDYFRGFYCGPCNLYLGAELNANASSSAYQSSNKEFVNRNFSRIQYKMGPSAGFSIIPGIVLTPCTLLYGRLGYVLEHFTIKSSNDISTPSGSDNLSGVRFGLGIQQAICNQLAIRMEYSRTTFSDYNSGLVIDRNSGVRIRTNLSPYGNQVEFGLVYKIC